jgi:hypothetical protein
MTTIQGWLAAAELSGKESASADGWKDSIAQVGRLRYAEIPEWVFVEQSASAVC